MQDKQGKTLLIYNCAKGLATTVEELSLDPNIDVNLSDNEGNTALIHAAQAGHTQIVQSIIWDRRPLSKQPSKAGLIVQMFAESRSRCLPQRHFQATLRLEWAEYVGRTECAHLIAHFMLSQRNGHNKSANESTKLGLNNTNNASSSSSNNKTAVRTNSNTFKQAKYEECRTHCDHSLTSMPSSDPSDRRSSPRLPAIARPRVRSAPPIPTLKITRPTSPGSANNSVPGGKQLAVVSTNLAIEELDPLVLALSYFNIFEMIFVQS
uniref:ANK_REP_REGION domain-containing protein n=1 Tax=Ditylenchus dipsaci TaxID=166011 RepID=A0A915DMG2_9BILA